MKKNIHPKYETATVICACGNTWQTKSTRPEIKIELCSNCHPLYTGKEVLIDTAGQVDKFNKRVAVAQTMQAKNIKKNAKKQPQVVATTPDSEEK